MTAAGETGERFRDLATTRAETLARLSAFSQVQLDFSPRPGRWSIGEVADHLRLSEKLWRDEVARLVALARAGRPALIKHTFEEINVSPLHIPTPILSMLETPFSIMNRFVPNAVIGLITEFPIMPTRNPDGATPRAGLSAAALTEGLKTSLEETRQLIEANTDLDFARMTSEHPLMGANTVPQILGFLVRHERRHHSQIRGVTESARFPPAHDRT